MAFRDDEDDKKKESSGGDSSSGSSSSPDSSGGGGSSSGGGQMTLDEFKSKISKGPYADAWNWQSQPRTGSVGNANANNGSLQALINYTNDRMNAGAFLSDGLGGYYQRGTGSYRPGGGYTTRGSSAYNQQQQQRNANGYNRDDSPQNATQGLLQNKDAAFGIKGIQGIGGVYADPWSDKWYSGDQPDAYEIAARIIATQGSNSEMLQKLMSDRANKDSYLYNAYGGITSEPLLYLGSLLSEDGKHIYIPQGGYTTEWFENHAKGIEQYLQYSKTSGEVVQPTGRNKRNKDAWKAYYFMKAWDDCKQTDQAEAQLAALKEEVKYLAGDKNHNYTDEEIIGSLDWSGKYSLLAKMNEGKRAGTSPFQFTRVVDFDTDYLSGMIWAARNGGGTGSDFYDTVYAHMGAGNLYQRNDDIAARRDPRNKEGYRPYSVGMASDEMREAGLYYGTYSFDDKWLEDHAADKTSSDKTRRTMYARVYDAVQDTKTYKTELDALYKRIDEDIQFGSVDLSEGSTYFDDLFAGSEYSHLRQLDESMARGKLRNTSEAIDYSRAGVEQYVRDQLAAKAEDPNGNKSARGTWDILGGIKKLFGGGGKEEEKPAPSPGELLDWNLENSDTQNAIRAEQDRKVAGAGALISDGGNDAEKGQWKYGSLHTGENTGLIKDGIRNGGMDAQGAGNYLGGMGDQAAGESYLRGLQIIREYHDAEAELKAAQDEVNRLTNGGGPKPNREEDESPDGGAPKAPGGNMALLQGGDGRRLNVPPRLLPGSAETASAGTSDVGGVTVKDVGTAIRDTEAAISNIDSQLQTMERDVDPETYDGLSAQRADLSEYLSNLKAGQSAEEPEAAPAPEGAPEAGPNLSDAESLGISFDDAPDFNSASVDEINGYLTRKQREIAAGTPLSELSDEQNAQLNYINGLKDQFARAQKNQIAGGANGESDELQIARNRLEYWTKHVGELKPGFDEANEKMRSVREYYEEQDRLTEASGGKLPVFRTLQLLDVVESFGHEFIPFQYSASDIFTQAETDDDAYKLLYRLANGAAPGEGAPKEPVKDLTKKIAQNNTDTLAIIDFTLKALDERNVPYPEEYRRNIEAYKAQLQHDLDAAMYVGLKENKDFRDVAGRIRGDINEKIQADSVLDGDLVSVMMDDEKDTLYYLYGKQGLAAAERYFNYLTNEYGTVTTRYGQAVKENIKGVYEMGPASGVTGTLETIAASPLNIMGAAYMVGMGLQGKVANPYSAWMAPGSASQEFRGGVEEWFNKTWGEGSWQAGVAKFGYNALVSAGDSYVNALLVQGAGLGEVFGAAPENAGRLTKLSFDIVNGTVAALPMGLSASAMTYVDVMQRTGDPQKAYLMAGITAFSESITEGLEMESVLDALGKGELTGHGFKVWMQSVGKASLNEAIGEGVSQIIENNSDEVILGAASNRAKLILSLEKDQKMSHEDAVRAANVQFWREVGYSALLGAASGGFSTGAAAATGEMRYNKTVNGIADGLARIGYGRDVAQSISRQAMDILAGQNQGGDTGSRIDGNLAVSAARLMQLDPNLSTDDAVELARSAREAADNGRKNGENKQTEQSAEAPQADGSEELVPLEGETASPQEQPEGIVPLEGEQQTAQPEALAPLEGEPETPAAGTQTEQAEGQPEELVPLRGEEAPAAQAAPTEQGEDLVPLQGEEETTAPAPEVPAAQPELVPLEGETEAPAAEQQPAAPQEPERFPLEGEPRAPQGPQISDERRSELDILGKQLAALAGIKNNFNSRGNADTITAVLDTFGEDGDLVRSTQTKAAARAMISRFGAPKAAKTLRSLLLAGAEMDIPADTVLQAVTQAALTNGDAFGILDGVAKTTAVGSDVQALVNAATQEAALPETQQRMQGSVVDTMAAERLQQMAAEGASAVMDKVKEAKTAAQEGVSNARKFMREKAALLKSAQENQARAYQEWMDSLANGGTDQENQRLEAAHQKSANAIPGALTAFNQAQDALKKAQSVLGKATRTYQKELGAWMGEHRAEAVAWAKDQLSQFEAQRRARQQEIEAQLQAEEETAAHAEQTVRDADALPDDALRKFHANESGSYDTAGNRDFMAGVLEAIIPEDQRGQYINADGTVTPEGVARVREAIYQRAFGDTSLIDILTGSENEDVRTLAAAIDNIAPGLAAMRERIASGEVRDIGLNDVIAQAAAAYAGIRANGETVSGNNARANIPGADQLSPAVRALLPVFEKYGKSAQQLTDILAGIGEDASLFTPGRAGDAPIASTEAIIANSLQGAEQRIAEGRGRQFDAETVDARAKEFANRKIEEHMPNATEQEKAKAREQIERNFREDERRAAGEQNEQVRAWRAENERRARAYAEQLSEKYGIKIVFDDAAGANGYYSNKDGSIHISPEASQTQIFNRVLFHELTHSIEGTGQYKQFQDIMISLQYGTTYEQMMRNREAGQMTRADQRLLAALQMKQNLYDTRGVELDDAAAMQELTADLTYRMFNGDQQAIRDFVKADPNLAQRILAKIKEFIQTLTGMSPDQTQTEFQKRLGKAQELFEQALRERETSGEDRQQYMFRDSNGQELHISQEQLDQNKRRVAEMESIIAISEEDANRFLNAGGDTLSEVKKYFDEIGRVVNNPTLGEVELSNSGLRHIIGKDALSFFKARTIAAIKPVIQSGSIVSLDENHGGKPVDTAMIAGKVSLPDGDYYVGVVVKQHNGGTKGQRNAYTFHDAWAIKKEGAAALQKGRVGEQDASVTLSSAPTIINILQEIAAVKSENENRQATIDDVDTPELRPENSHSGDQFSVPQLAAAGGFGFETAKNGVPFEYNYKDSNGNERTVRSPYRMFDQNGNTVTEITPDMIRSAPLGRLITAAENAGTINSETAKAQLKMFADLATLAARYGGDMDMVWEIANAQMFSSLKNNSDAQYSTTIDYGTICAKTQAIVDVLSQEMLRKGRGLSREEVLDVYRAVAGVGLDVPCPVCYVFSRWMGVPSLLNRMSEYQERFAGMSQKEVQNYIKDVQKRYGKDAKNAAKAINSAKTRLDSRIGDLTEQYGQAKTRDERKAIAQQIDALEAEFRDVDAYNWVTQVLCKETSKGSNEYVLDPNFKPVPKSVLFDLNNTGDFASGYPKSWLYRNTRGAGMGKSIMPYSGAQLGDVIKPRGKNAQMRWDEANNPIFTGNTKKVGKLIRNAINRMKAQNLIGGQRFQSTSDYRPEWGLDYMMTFLEMQAVGAKAQLYTKVIEAVDLFAHAGAEVNLSLMGKGKGYHIDADGNVVLDFSNVTGIDAEQARQKILQYDNVQGILVGLNDTHIRAAMASDWINFIIPWHSSGNTKSVLSSMLEAVREVLDPSEAMDYSSEQNDTTLENRTQEQKDAWDVRMKLLTGKLRKGGHLIATQQELATIESNPYLKDLYRRFYLDESETETYGVKLTASQAEHIFPFEYWDTNSTLENADVNGQRFAEYCESVGMKPRFERFKNDHGYWKLLIDRSMYNNDGSYHTPRTLDVTNVRVEDIATRVGHQKYGDQAKYDEALARLDEMEQAKVDDAEALVSPQFDPSFSESASEGMAEIFDESETEADEDDRQYSFDDAGPGTDALLEQIREEARREIRDRMDQERRDQTEQERRAANDAQRNIDLYERRKGGKPTLQGLYTQVFDDLNPLDKITQREVRNRQRQIEEIRQKQKNGETLTEEEQTMLKRGMRGFDSTQDPREMMRHKRNVVPNFLEISLGDYMLDPQGNRIVKNQETGEQYGGLNDIVKNNVQASEELDFNQYLADLALSERLVVDLAREGNLQRQVELQERIGQLQGRIAQTEAQHQNWRNTSEEINQWVGQFMQSWLVDTGLMRQSTLDNFRKMYPHYVPLFESREGTQTPNGLNPEESGQQGTNRLGRRSGGEAARYQNPMVSLVAQLQSYMEFEKQAEAYRAFDAAMDTEDARAIGWAEAIGSEQQEDTDNPVGAIESMSNFSWWSQDLNGSVLHVPMADGSVRSWLVHDDGMFAAMTRDQATNRLKNRIAQTPGLGAAFRVASSLTRFLCAMSTSRNLNFALQNHLSDGNTAVITGSTHGNLITYNIERLGTMLRLLGEHASERRGGLEATSRTYQDFKAFAEMGRPWQLRSGPNQRELRADMYGRDTTAEGRRAANRAHWQEVGTLGELIEVVHNATGFIFKPVTTLADFLEETTRFNEWARGRHDLSTYEGKIAAATATREVTVDFSLQGANEAMALYGQLVPFARAQLQGTYKTMRMFSEQNAGKRMKTLGRIVMNTLLSSMLMEGLRQIGWDDEERDAYDEMSAYEKMKYAHLKLPNGQILRLKRSQDSIIQLANAVGETLMDLSTGYEDNDFAQLADFIQQVAGNMVPSRDTIFDAFIDAANNRTWYGGAIEGSKYAGLAESDKYDADTLPIFRGMSELVQHIPLLPDYSPLDMEYICQQYLGSAGRILIGAGQAGMEGDLDISELLDIAGGEVLGKLTYDPVYSSYASSEFYDSLSQLDAIVSVADQGRTESGYLRKMEPGEFKAAARRAKELTSNGGQLSGIRKDISRLWKRYNDVEKGTLSDREKDEMKRKIRDQINRKALQGNTIIARYMKQYGKKSLKQGIAENVTEMLREMGM